MPCGVPAHLKILLHVLRYMVYPLSLDLPSNNLVQVSTLLSLFDHYCLASNFLKVKRARIALGSHYFFHVFFSFVMFLADLKESITRVNLSIEQMYCDPLLQQVKNAALLGKY